MNIYEKLQNSRVELQSMQLKKSGKNAFAKFSYFELADFLPEINKIFSEKKLATNFSIVDSIAKLEIINSEKAEEKMCFESPIANADVKGCTAIQSLGAVHTYMKRYLYLNALEIVENDMLDPNIGNPEIKPKGDFNSISNLTAKEEAKKMLDKLDKPLNDEEILKAITDDTLPFEENYACEICGVKFKPMIYDGKEMTAKEVYELVKSKSKGKAICRQCKEKGDK